jgi:DNA topoisomerase VI subunit B
VEYFKRLIADKTRQAKQRTKITIISDKAQEASYAVARIVAKKKMKSQTTVESVIENNIFCEEYEKEILQIPVR